MAETKPKNLAEALIAFQASVPTIHENDSSFHGKFANLAGVLGTINPALRKAGLAVSQLPEEVEGKPGLRTTLMHTSGEQITAVTPLAVATGKNITQEWGKSVTYQRRYALQSILGICCGIEDTDADSEPEVRSVPTPAQQQQPAKKAAAKSPDLPKDKLDALIAQLKGLKPEYMTTMCKAFIPKFDVPNGVKVGAFIKTQEHSDWITNYMLENEP